MTTTTAAMKQQHDTRSGNAPLSQEQLEARIEQ